MIKSILSNIIDCYNSICYKINLLLYPTPIDKRYSTKYFLYVGDGLLDHYKNRHIAYAGLVSDAPVVYQNVLIKDIELGITEDYVIIFDNWK